MYANKMDNLAEMDKFLEWYNFPKLNQEELENIKQDNHKYFETIVTVFHQTKVQDQMASQAISIEHLKVR